jgi:hypothetical protein
MQTNYINLLKIYQYENSWDITAFQLLNESIQA